MKKLVSCVVALAMIGSASASAPFNNAAVSGGVIADISSQAQAATRIVFGCDDEKLGHFDLCVDVLMMNQNNGDNIYMRTKFNTELTQNYQNILVRYAFGRKKLPVNYQHNWIHIHDEENGTIKTMTIPNGVDSFFYKQSHDGGVTWSEIDHYML